jgi:hypothetical protein
MPTFVTKLIPYLAALIVIVLGLWRVEIWGYHQAEQHYQALIKDEHDARAAIVSAKNREILMIELHELNNSMARLTWQVQHANDYADTIDDLAGRLSNAEARLRANSMPKTPASASGPVTGTPSIADLERANQAVYEGCRKDGLELGRLASKPLCECGE